VDPSQLVDYGITAKATAVIHRGLQLAREAPRPVR
jgi:hypothetical protein